jgi:hypothetical protein
MNLFYNMKTLGQLIVCGTKVSSKTARVTDRKGAPAMA